LHQGGLWEFPGGKLEAQESLEDALRREIREELGLELLGHRPLISVAHRYPDRRVVLDVHLVTEYRGEARGLEGQPLEWVQPGDLARYPMPAADRPIVSALTLPDRYLITGADPTDPQRFLSRLAQALDDGIKLVQLRAPKLSDDELFALAEASLQLCRQSSARLMFNGSLQMAERLDVDGIHLNSRRLMALRQRPLQRQKLVACSCHSAAELARATELKLDFAVLSPVLPTPSHPQAPSLGWERFSELTSAAGLPVFALGGMRKQMIPEAWNHGAQGIAGISGLWPNS
jgi:8-oxo-dGTP diphosphatase